MLSPVSWIFGLALPLGIFIIMQVIMNSIGDTTVVPMFAVDRFTGGVIIFGGSFLTLFTALRISDDRSKAFLTRLYASPMRGWEYIAGYVLGVSPIAVLGSAVTLIAAMCFGVTLSANLITAFLFSIVLDMLFVAIGVIFGSVLDFKTAPPVSSVVVQAAALLSGMWFDLDTIGGGFAVFCKVFPFAHCYDVMRYTIAGDYKNVWAGLLIVIAYTAVLFALAAVLFVRMSKRCK